MKRHIISDYGEFILAVILGNIFVITFALRQNFIPYWDYSTYYKQAIDLSNLMFSNFPEALKEIYRSMLYEDYGKLPVVLLAPFFKLINPNFSTYIILLFNLYMVPFLFVLRSIDKRLCLLALIFPPFIIPLLRGYPDISGLVVIALLLCGIHSSKPRKLRHLILAAILLVVLVFCRRYYLFLIISTFITIGIMYFVDRDSLKLRQALAVGLIALGIMLVFFFPFVARVVGYNYLVNYNAYQSGSILWNIQSQFLYYGIIPLFLALLGVVSGWIQNRYFTGFLVVQGLITFFMFISIQSLSPHHQYLVALNVFLLMCLTFPKGLRRLAIWGVLGMYFLMTFLPLELSPAFSNKTLTPLVRDDAPVIHELASYLDELTAGTEDYVYVLSSSEVFNDDMLRNRSLPHSRQGVTNLYGTSHVDARDGFPEQIMDAKYFVVAEPIQLHLRENSQRYVEIPAREILDGMLTSHMEQLRVFELKEDVKVRVYRLIEPLSAETQEALRELVA